MIINISLIVIGLCFLFILYNKRIKVNPFVGLVLCFFLVFIIGALAKTSQIITDIAWDGIVSMLALFVYYETYMAYKRGSL